jgi:hypothetical protein
MYHLTSIRIWILFAGCSTSSKSSANSLEICTQCKGGKDSFPVKVLSQLGHSCATWCFSAMPSPFGRLRGYSEVVHLIKKREIQAKECGCEFRACSTTQISFTSKCVSSINNRHPQLVKILLFTHLQANWIHIVDAICMVQCASSWTLSPSWLFCLHWLNF